MLNIYRLSESDGSFLYSGHGETSTDSLMEEGGGSDCLQM